MPPDNLARVPAALRPAADATLRRLGEIFLRTPSLAQPVGFDLAPALMAYAPIGAASAAAPLGYSVTLGFRWYVYMPGARAVQALPVGMAGVMATANDATALFNEADRWGEDARGRVYLEPRQLGAYGGQPFYGGNTSAGVKILLSRSGRVPWVPVPRERALRIALVPYERVTPELRARFAPRVRDAHDHCLAELRGQLSWSPAELAAPAWVMTEPPRDRSFAGCSLLTDASYPKRRMLVAEDTAFYDRSLPKTTIQLLTIGVGGWHSGRAWQDAVLERVAQEIDYRALLQLMK